MIIEGQKDFEDSYYTYKITIDSYMFVGIVDLKIEVIRYITNDANEPFLLFKDHKSYIVSSSNFMEYVIDGVKDSKKSISEVIRRDRKVFKLLKRLEQELVSFDLEENLDD